MIVDEGDRKQEWWRSVSIIVHGGVRLIKANNLVSLYEWNFVKNERCVWCEI